MAKKAELKNLASLQGVNIFKNGLLPTQPSGAEPVEEPVAAMPVSIQPAPAATPVQITLTQPAVSASQPVQEATTQEEKKMLRSYHLPESLIQRLEDAHMVYQLRKENKDKQDIVVDALTRYLDELERQGFFDKLKALRA